MKRTAILLEEDVLLEIQQLAKEYQITTSQVIQRAIAEYLDTERQLRLHASAMTRGEISALRSARRSAEPIRYVRETAAPASEPPADPSEGSGEVARDTRRGSAEEFLPLLLGLLTAILALFELTQAIGGFAGQVRPVEVVINYLLPAVLLGAVAAAFLFLAVQNRRSRSA